MLTIIIALAAGVLAAWGCGQAWGNYAWGGLIGAAVVVTIQVVVGLLVRRKVNAVQLEIQSMMNEVQTKIQRKINNFQQRPGMAPKQFQAQLEGDQRDAVHAAIKLTGKIEPFFKWSLLLDRQINTMRLMLHFQLKEYAEVDRLMKRSIFVDPQVAAMKLARMYMLNDVKLDKFAQKKLRTARGDAATILFAAYSWILVKRGDIAGAIKILTDAKKRCGNAVLKDNLEKLQNDKVKNFSNADLGDRWYVLFLEEPKMRTQRQQRY